jgi:hypothetical protein
LATPRRRDLVEGADVGAGVSPSGGDLHSPLLLGGAGYRVEHDLALVAVLEIRRGSIPVLGGQKEVSNEEPEGHEPVVALIGERFKTGRDRDRLEPIFTKAGAQQFAMGRGIEAQLGRVKDALASSAILVAAGRS